MDPYVYPGTHVLINKFDERNALKLLKLERRLSMLATLELRIKTFKIFNFSTLQYIHRKMFEDIYSWAGEIRKVESMHYSNEGFKNILCEIIAEREE